MMRKRTAWLIAICIAAISFAQVPLASADERTTDHYYAIDVFDHWAERELTDFLLADVFKGYQNENGQTYLNPDADITRAQFTAILVRALGLEEREGSAKRFPDVSDNHAMKKEIAIASSHGIIQGTKDGSFQPNEKIRRDQLVTMIVRAFENTIDFSGEARTFHDVTDQNWAKAEIDAASSVGLVQGDRNDQFRPSESATRAHAAVMLFRALEQEQWDVPDAEFFKNVILSSEERENELVGSGNIDELHAHNEQRFLGYFKTLSDQSVDNAWDLYHSYDRLDFTLIEEPDIHVLKATDRFAVVELTGGMLEVYTELYGSGSHSFGSYENTYYLRKDKNEWKIYFVDFGYVSGSDMEMNERPSIFFWK
ncbi:hypothetical protein JCM9140_2333 [Halalkalibacter wakoensis JCM 9140]|uniref:SLH domain-containing protein n=1 Tax=Halalkalibacter wakoensis JCM 9140 TaxID=1236970 RepID=W4Q4J1_9BACI|nr:S-layer homology domain-containing protein [Halalkalibacter wakoensis]GAE26284.1 hypothetical protein JCM9140_2333 [Halalkalibacter wakoensis JCM 9140]